jgi:flagellar M-ring protein FliF
VVGSGRARVQLTADFDYNKITQTSDKFDPEGRVLRSSQSREESAATANANDGQVTVNNELPGGQGQGGGATAKDQSKKSEEINNYEISRVTKTEVTEAGRVNRISVAVLVDGSYSKNDKGEVVYAARSKEDLDRIGTLVRSAIGFDQKRGDQVEIVNLRFADVPSVIPADAPKGFLGMFQFTKDDIMYFVELGVMLVLGIIVVFMVVRPLLKRVLAADPAAAIPAPAPALPEVAPQPVQPQIAATSMIDVAQVQGQVHAQSVHRVGELADRNPNETATIIRQWLSEPA